MCPDDVQKLSGSWKEDGCSSGMRRKDCELKWIKMKKSWQSPKAAAYLWFSWGLDGSQASMSTPQMDFDVHMGVERYIQPQSIHNIMHFIARGRTGQQSSHAVKRFFECFHQLLGCREKSWGIVIDKRCALARWKLCWRTLALFLYSGRKRRHEVHNFNVSFQNSVSCQYLSSRLWPVPQQPSVRLRLDETENTFLFVAEQP